MVVTLYVPGQPARAILPDGFELPDPITGFARVTSRVAQELGCLPNLVDVQACGPEFAAYTIFDYDRETNTLGMAALEKCLKQPYSLEDDDQLCGPLLLVTL